MINISSTWLIEKIRQHASSDSLWLSDENLLHQLPDTTQWPQKPKFISNRWDVAEAAKKLTFNASFNDFDLHNFTDDSIDHIFYRISKEKAVTHHIINQAQRLLKPQGTLWLCGQKNEGIKTYIEKACDLLGCEKNILKDGTSYSSTIIKGGIKGTTHGDSLINRLPDDNYTNLRECFQINGNAIVSKPGQFGWNKIDLGSAFLIAECKERLLAEKSEFAHCLDLGCGYGYLTIAIQGLPIKKFTLTDNNAAAITSAQANCRQLAIAADIIAGDAGLNIENTFDLILSNPPFHQGFNVDSDLTDKFLQNAHRLLTQKGVAYFVVNQFIPLEKKAANFFTHIKLIAKNKSFKIIALRKYT